MRLSPANPRQTEVRLIDFDHAITRSRSQPEEEWTMAVDQETAAVQQLLAMSRHAH